MKPEVDQKIEMTIDRLTYNGGRGIGRYNNLAIFVPDTAPGDSALVQITQVKKNYAVGKLVQLLQASQTRRTAECSYFEACGGCQWQHINYEEQIEQKRLFLQKTLQNLNAENIDPSVSKAPSEFSYRNRIQLHKSKNKLGYFKSKSHELVEIDQCKIAHQKINEKIADLLAQAKNPLPKKFEIALTTNQDVILRNPSLPMTASLFSQVNTEVNELLVKQVIQLCGDKADYSKIYDVYCGQGNFSFPLLEKFPKTSFAGIELSRENVKQAQKKYNALNLEPTVNVDFFASKAEAYFRKKPAEKNSLIILDPPRTGCDKTLFQNIGGARKIIYVSCNLSTFERDSRLLAENNFQLSHLEGFDMFPQTSHIETVAVFNKN